MTIARLGVVAAFMYTGVDGPLNPFNKLSFPLFCKAEFTHGPGGELVYTGLLQGAGCTAGAMSFGPSGMGATYREGGYKPTCEAMYNF